MTHFSEELRKILEDFNNDDKHIYEDRLTKAEADIKTIFREYIKRNLKKFQYISISSPSQDNEGSWVLIAWINKDKKIEIHNNNIDIFIKDTLEKIEKGIKNE